MPVNAPNDNLDVLAPSFNLKNVDDKMVSLDNAKGLNGTVIVFICNHCPYVKAIASRLKKDADELLEHSINTIAIMSNDVINYPDDSFDNMKIFSEKYKFNFPYLYDETQEVAKNYNAVCTPDIFGFDNWSKALEGVDVLIHCASKVHCMNKFQKNYEEFEKINVLATKKLAIQAAKSRVKRFIFLSTVTVHGENTKKGFPFKNCKGPH